MLKKLFLLLILVLFISSGCNEKSNNSNVYDSIIKRGKMIVGISFDSKPFGFQDSKGQIQGMEADLAREIAKRILGDSSKIEFVNVTSQDRIKVATSGDVDMIISTLTITPQRKRIVEFSTPYFVAGQAVSVKKDSKIDSIEDLINKKIIVIFGTTGEKNIKQFVPSALFQGYENNSEAMEAFKSGFYDAITTDDALLQGLVVENQDYIILPNRLTKEPYGIAFKKSRKTKNLRQKVDQIIKELSEDGTLNTIADKWIKF